MPKPPAVLAKLEKAGLVTVTTNEQGQEMWTLTPNVAPRSGGRWRWQGTMMTAAVLDALLDD